MPLVLILHGFGSNAEIAKEQTPNLCRSLEILGFRVEYVDAPIKLKPQDFPFEDVNDCVTNDLFCWWYLNKEASLDETFNMIHSKYYYNERVIGVIGISQGGSLTTILGSNHISLIPSLRFAISFGGYLYPDPWKEPDLNIYKDVIDIHYLNIYGDNDELVKPEISEKINAFGESVESLVHHQGHTFADNDSKCIRQVIQWIKQLR